jgi:hypothetical protein
MQGAKGNVFGKIQFEANLSGDTNPFGPPTPHHDSFMDTR